LRTWLLGFLFSISFSAPSLARSCTVDDDSGVLSKPEIQAIFQSQDYLTNQIPDLGIVNGQAVPSHFSSAQQQRALAAAEVSMRAEIKAFVAANHLQGLHLGYGSPIAIRVLKYPVLRDYLGSDADQDASVLNPFPLSESTTWLPWARAWRAGQARMEIYFVDSSKRLHLFKTMTIHQINGTPGPKSQEGDFQVPEGLFDLSGPTLDTAFLVAMEIEYNPLHLPGLGSQILVHGNGESTGCLNMGNLQSVELAALVKAAKAQGHLVPLLIEPFDLGSEQTLTTLVTGMTDTTAQRWSQRMSQHPDLQKFSGIEAFWRDLQQSDATWVSRINRQTLPVSHWLHASCDH